MDQAIQALINRYFSPFRKSDLCRAKEDGAISFSQWKQLLITLKGTFSNYTIKDFSNLENDWCFVAEVLLHKHEKSFLDDDRELLRHLGGKKRSLLLFVSILTPYYYYYVSEMSYDVMRDQFIFSYYRPTELEEEEVIQPLRTTLESYGYQLLPTELAKSVLPNLETECLEKGQVTVFHCLFSELFSPH